MKPDLGPRLFPYPGCVGYSNWTEYLIWKWNLDFKVMQNVTENFILRINIRSAVHLP